MLRTIIVTALLITSWLCSALALRQLSTANCGRFRLKSPPFNLLILNIILLVKIFIKLNINIVAFRLLYVLPVQPIYLDPAVFIFLPILFSNSDN